MVPRVRIELTTLASSGRRSTNELPRHIIAYVSVGGFDRIRTCDLLGVNETL